MTGLAAPAPPGTRLEIGTLQLVLPAGLARRADAIGRLVGPAIGAALRPTADQMQTVRARAMRVEVGPLDPALSDRAIADRLAATVVAELATMRSAR